ncbi:hypothetical protein TVAG_026630 [Trichomonas vaginalis G3]|uniref:DUF3447 domain-containing protein n=1 Tax=Trichomonas vaginalis (strain ATCC PRA-98 / G3) TaxID=412133 RepID=A2DZ66_TRIV3|nr:proteasome regulatory particle assembly [Trichomonas vaginalis G3]EAY14342.1 hypothetical protein TVAG_026630 [Trichomonas vaginalis G3]KAI5517367.1 proteasome regulatory particle assembly [Trichomonas vaginalis G3]|eukprot:XP_001326565.1 hypothetical protein [Trichomonas vaginalis G3]
MSDLDKHPNKYSRLRSIYKYYIDSFIALYQLKTKDEEDLNSIYKIIKTELIDSMKYPPQNFIRSILSIIPYNNRYTMSYLKLIKFIYDDYHVKEVRNIVNIFNFMFYKEYGIKLDNSSDFEDIKSENLIIHSENTIYRAIIDNNLEKFILFTECDEFDENQKLNSSLFPFSNAEYSLLEVCCYYGAVDCFKLLRTKFKSTITEICLDFSFLCGNQEIMSECLKYQRPDNYSMKYAIISHNIDFVTFLTNEYNIEIDLEYCGIYKNLDALLVYYDQTNNVDKCILYSALFEIPCLCEYFLSLGANINEKNDLGETALIFAADFNYIEMIEFLILHGANINEKNNQGEIALHYAADNNHKEMAELLISHGANINEKDENGKTALHYTVEKK